MSDTNLSGFNEFASNSTKQPTSVLGHPTHSLEKYRPELGETGLSDKQETEILEILWSIMWHFAKTGQSVDVCGQFFSDANQPSDSESAKGIMKPSPDKETPSKQGGKEAT